MLRFVAVPLADFVGPRSYLACSNPGANIRDGGKTVHVVFNYLSESLLYKKDLFPADPWIIHFKMTYPLFSSSFIVNCTFLEDDPVPFAGPLSSPFFCPFLSSVRPPLSSIWIPLSSSPLLVGLTPVILALCMALIKYGYYEQKVKYGTIQKNAVLLTFFKKMETQAKS
jgi:hypothetical protein